MTIENISWSISTNVANLGGGWTRDLLVSSWTAHPTEPPNWVSGFFFWVSRFVNRYKNFWYLGIYPISFIWIAFFRNINWVNTSKSSLSKVLNCFCVWTFHALFIYFFFIYLFFFIYDLSPVKGPDCHGSHLIPRSVLNVICYSFEWYFKVWGCGGQLFWLPFCFPANQTLSVKGSSLKGKNLLPQGTNSFLLEKTPFQKGGKSNFFTVNSWESIPIKAKDSEFD